MRSAFAAFAFASVASAAHAQDADWARVVEAAKKEGSVAVYSALSGPPQVERMKAFEKQYGIRVDHFIARASEVVERIRIEQVSKRYNGDVYISSPTSLPVRKQAGDIQPMMSVPAMSTLRGDLGGDGNGVPVWYPPYGILINTNMVKPEEFKSWKGLLDPKWKGKMLSDDLRLAGAGGAMFEATYKAFGREYHDALAKQDVSVTRNNREAERRVARGEYAVYFPQQLPFALALKGLPVKMIVPDEGVVYALAQFALLTGAPHPNAARVLTQYMLEPESQLYFANSGVIPVVKGIAEKTNDDARPYMSSNLFGAGTYEHQERLLAIAAEIYK
jgi:iron(III) transport system substrate-binding protein